jgi:hypothetical protein
MCLWRQTEEMEVWLLPICNMAQGGGQSAPRSGYFTPEKDLVPTVQKTQWASGLVCMTRKTSPPLGFNPQTIQPIESHYTNCTIPPSS